MGKANRITHKQSIDHQTGELIQEETIRESWVETEPDYVKVYLKDIIKVKDLPKGTSTVLFALLKRMTYNNDIVISAALRRAIGSEIGLVERTVKKGIEELVKADILIRKDRGFYLFNPFLFGRGKWTDIRKIRMTIDYGKSGKEIKTEFQYSENEKI